MFNELDKPDLIEGLKIILDHSYQIILWKLKVNVLSFSLCSGMSVSEIPEVIGNIDTFLGTNLQKHILDFSFSPVSR